MNVKKSLLLLLIVPLLFFVYSCGGGSGSGYNPSGTGSGEVSKVELSPTRYIAQTNGCINIYARVIDGDGAYLSNTPVTFTNLSSTGQILNKCGGGQVTSAITDSNGLAKVALYSTTPGFSTIQAEVYKGAGQIRDRKTVYFSTHDLTLLPSLSLEVESVPSNETSGPTIYNDIHDITLFENDGDDVVEVIATVRDIYGIPIAYEPVSWYSSHPEAGFSYAEAMTNSKGKAKAIVHVTPSSIRETETSVNIMAYAYNGAANITTLFLKSVVISKSASSLTAYPNVVNVNGSSAVTAVIKLNTGAPAPSGISVNFTTTCGYIDPFSLISSNGVATATFKSPPTEGSCEVKAIVGGIELKTDIKVTTDLIVLPSKQTVNGVEGGSATFKIFGGFAPYSVVSNDKLLPSSLSGSIFTVSVPKNTPPKTVTYTVRDSAGKTKDATLEIGAGTTLSIKPTEVTVNTNASTEDQEISFYIFGGVPNYTIIKDKDDDTIELDKNTVTNSGGKFVATVKKDAAAGTAVITVIDSVGNIATAKIIITADGGGGGTGTMSISPAVVSVAGIKNPDSSTVDNLEFLILGSDHILFNCISSNPAIIASPGSTGAIFTVDPDEVLVATPVTITCTDFGGLVASTLVTVNPPGLTIRLNPIHVIGRANPAGGDGDITDDVLVTVVGGIGPYIVNIEPFSLTTIVPGGPWANNVLPWTFLVDPTNVLTNTVVTFKVTDGLGTTATADLVVYTENTGLVASTDKENVIGLTNPDLDTADDVTITVAGANNPFIVSWVCPDIAATPASPLVVAGTSGTVTFDPDRNNVIPPVPVPCTVNVTDNLGSAATLNVTVWP